MMCTRGNMIVWKAWSRDFTNTDLALRKAGAIRTDPDGFQWVDEAKAGRPLARLYADLRTIGYANGFIDGAGRIIQPAATP